RYVAKQGPVLLALKTGAAIFCFHISMKHKIQLNSWDQFQIPLPFTTAVVLQAPPIWVPTDASEAHLRALHERMQTILDDLRKRGDSRGCRLPPGITSFSQIVKYGLHSLVEGAEVRLGGIRRYSNRGCLEPDGGGEW